MRELVIVKLYSSTFSIQIIKGSFSQLWPVLVPVAKMEEIANNPLETPSPTTLRVSKYIPEENSVP